MDRVLGGLLIGITFMFKWVFSVALFLFLLGYIIFMFIQQGVLAGFIAVIIAIVASALAKFLYNIAILPIALVAANLWNKS